VVGEVRLNFALNDLDQRAIRKALAERMGRLIEIVGDTTQMIASRRAASREVRLIASVLRRLRANDLRYRKRGPRSTARDPCTASPSTINLGLSAVTLFEGAVGVR
jgi:hypothetical protein